jgi:branched-chain amino acid transport system ATP-binding protein
MSRSESDEAVELIRKVTTGRTLVMVEHDMGVVFDLADRISVLVYGEIIACRRLVEQDYLGAAGDGDADLQRPLFGV